MQTLCQVNCVVIRIQHQIGKITSREDIRELIEGNYRIVYQVFTDRLVVLTVFEGHQLFPEEKVIDSS